MATTDEMATITLPREQMAYIAVAFWHYNSWDHPEWAKAIGDAAMASLYGIALWPEKLNETVATAPRGMLVEEDEPERDDSEPSYPSMDGPMLSYPNDNGEW